MAACRKRQRVGEVLVIQCAGCRSILGDTAHNADRAVALGGYIAVDFPVAITKSHDSRTSREGIDCGATFTKLHCVGCGNNVGREYVTTPKSLDTLRGRCAFSTLLTTTYRVGLGAPSRTRDDEEETDSGSGDVDESAVLIAEVDATATDEMRDDLTRMQQVILGLHERLMTLEPTGGGDTRSNNTT